MKKLEVFKASWCFVCPTNKEIEELEGKFNINMFTLDFEEHMKYANKLNIKSLPCFIVDGERKYFSLKELIENEIA